MRQLFPVEAARQTRIDDTGSDKVIRSHRLLHMGEMRTLDALLMHPDIAGIERTKKPRAPPNQHGSARPQHMGGMAMQHSVSGSKFEQIRRGCHPPKLARLWKELLALDHGKLRK